MNDPRNLNSQFINYDMNQGIQPQPGINQGMGFQPGVNQGMGFQPGMNQGMGFQPGVNQGMGFQPGMQVQVPLVIMCMGIQMNLINDPLIELSMSRNVYIKQEMELLEILTGCETKNRYHVYTKNQYGQWTYLFKCKEESGWCARNCISSDSRPFKLKVKHIANGGMYGDDFNDSSTYAVFERPFKCTCLCLDRPEMSGHKKTGEYLGKVHEPCTCCDPEFRIHNNRGDFKYVITAECCQCGLICRNSCGRCSEVLFQIHKTGKTEMTVYNQDGYIKRLFSGLMQEALSDADNFELVFPSDATPEEKLMLIGNVMMIDYRYYEDNGNNSRSHRHHY